MDGDDDTQFNVFRNCCPYFDTFYVIRISTHEQQIVIEQATLTAKGCGGRSHSDWPQLRRCERDHPTKISLTNISSTAYHDNSQTPKPPLHNHNGNNPPHATRRPPKILLHKPRPPHRNIQHRILPRVPNQMARTMPSNRGHRRRNRRLQYYLSPLPSPSSSTVPSSTAPSSRTLTQPQSPRQTRILALPLPHNTLHPPRSGPSRTELPPLARPYHSFDRLPLSPTSRTRHSAQQRVRTLLRCGECVVR